MGIVPAVLQNSLPSGAPAASVLDGFIRGGATGTDFDNVVTGLGRLPNSRTVAQAVGQTMPALHGNVPSTLMNLGASTAIAIQQQWQGSPVASLQAPSGANFGGGGGAGGRSTSGQGLWVKALGNRLNQDTVDGASGYKLSTTGLIGGLQSELNATTTLGFGLGYLGSEVAGQEFAAGQNSDIESLQLVGYGQYAVGNAGWQLNWQGDFTRSRVESERNIAFMGRTALARYHGDAWHLGVGIRKAYTLNPQTTVQPGVALDWRSFKAEGYTETGAGALNLQVNEQTAQEAILKVGAELQQQLTPQTQWLASAALGYDLRHQRNAVTARFSGGGVAFTTEGLPAARTLGELGLGIRHQASDSVELVARYDLRLRKGLRDQTASVRLNWAF
ncbi:MAG: autotransporter outer membrane beta-barrel domain-containing protein [Hydrogenophaga sp.]|nr:autotransporter outer membrane beta-barrel domain-containing protein [Hydrogenophaga sp.]